MEARAINNRAAACFVQDDGSVVVYSRRIGTPPIVGDLVRLVHPPASQGPMFDRFSGPLTVRSLEYTTFALLPEDVKNDTIALLRGMAPQPYAPYVKHVLA